ncbi:hypothetical protein [Micromonospora sp. RTP1Z1]|nr:hypothetical protein [Micromonospora sp. RTP1Z1]
MAEPDQPSTARMIDFWLGGEHHFPVDVAGPPPSRRRTAPAR